MALYTRPQLLLLLSLLAAAGVGLGVMHWRAAHPEIVERLERIDREIAATAEAGADESDVARVTETREAVGRFAAVDDLATVQGVGRVKLERLRPFVGVTE